MLLESAGWLIPSASAARPKERRRPMAATCWKASDVEKHGPSYPSVMTYPSWDRTEVLTRRRVGH